jgi:predicted N-acetyltransferase YhbS
MRFLSFDELPHATEPSRALLQIAAFHSFTGRAKFEVFRRHGRCADYGGVFAVEGDRVLGEVYVLRIPYTLRDREETVAGLATVTANPDRRRVGIARRLLQEAHDRERDAGISFVTLWTNPSWGAHALYGKLGYRDVYSAPWAVRISAPVSRRRASGTPLRFARESELRAIEQLHDRVHEGRLGFCRRPEGYFRAMSAIGRFDPTRQLLVHERGSRPVGYAHLDRTPQRTICGELVAPRAADRRALIEQIVRTTVDSPCAFQHSVVSDSSAEFAGPRYARSRSTWWVWMAARLGGEWTAREATHRLATDDPRFVCHAGDRF